MPIDPVQGMHLLVEQNTKARELLNSPITAKDFDSWVLLTENYLKKAFGPDSDNVSRVLDHTRHFFISLDHDENWWAEDRADRLKSIVAANESLITVLETEVKLSITTKLDPAPNILLHRVFVVHGHDDAVLYQTARLLENLKLDAVVLREQPNQGRTVIEKFEDYSDVAFAVVPLTPDDVGGKSGSELQGRARQNVIFELGYFIAKLGRERVCALYLPTVEIPSDYPVLYVPFDDKGSWRFELAKEMKAAGLTINMDLI